MAREPLVLVARRPRPRPWYIDKVAAKSGQNAAGCPIDSSTMRGKKGWIQEQDKVVHPLLPAVPECPYDGQPGGEKERERKRERQKGRKETKRAKTDERRQRHPSPPRQNRVA